MNRQQLRQQMRRARRALTAQQQKRAARSVKQRFFAHTEFHRCRRIGVYLTNDGEISPQDIIKTALARGIQVFLPVLNPVKKHQLWFVRYQPGMPMVKNCYGIDEPHPRHYQRCPLHSLDLLLVPLVAFDKQGGRLGMGGGYYDRTLSYRPRLAPYNQPKLIGLAHELQCVEQLEIASWDIPMTGVLTDRNFYRC